eukprot:6521412-Prymnesium_polylepis.1
MCIRDSARCLALRALLVQRLSRTASERQFTGSSRCEGLSESVSLGEVGRAGHGTARHDGTARHGAVGWCRAGGRE